MNKTIRNLTLVFFMFSLTVITAFGAYTIYSTIVQVDVTDYTVLTLKASSNGLFVTLTGTLTETNTDPIVGAMINLYTVTDIDGTSPTLLTSIPTDTNGYYSYTYTVLTEDTYYYRASYEVS